MAALEWPNDICPASLTWRPESNTKTFRSPFNGVSQTVRFPGTRWVCSLTFNNLSDEKSRRIDALIAELDGEYGRVKIHDWGRGGSTGRCTGCEWCQSDGDTIADARMDSWRNGFETRRLYHCER